MSIKLDKYTPLMMYLSPASIPQIVAHIQDYLVKHPILSVETIAEIIVQSLQEHPELINGEAIPISADSAQSIKAYIDALPALDTYTKAEINALLLGKQDTLTFDQAPTPGSSNPVTSSGIIAAMSALQSALETHISAKADRASTYTKTQVDTLLEDKADADDVYTKNTMDAKLLEINTDIDNIEDDVSHQSQQIDDLGPLNVLTSDSTIAALSAAMGKALKQAIDNLTIIRLMYHSPATIIVMNADNPLPVNWSYTATEDCVLQIQLVKGDTQTSYNVTFNVNNIARGYFVGLNKPYVSGLLYIPMKANDVLTANFESVTYYEMIILKY